MERKNEQLKQTIQEFQKIKKTMTRQKQEEDNELQKSLDIL